MATALTLAQFIDEVRRYLQIVPYVDYTTPGASGAQPPEDPDPNNATIIQAINDGIDIINRMLRAGLATELTITTSLPTINTRGIWYTDISSVIPDALTATEIIDISWSDNVNTIRLAPFDYYAAERDYTQFQQLSPGRPQYFVLTGSEIGVIPPPSTTGILFFNAFVTIPPLVNLTDTLSYIPIEYQDTIIYWGVVMCSYRQAMDVEAATRAQSFLPLAQQGTMEIYSWKNGFTNTGIADIRETLQMIYQQKLPADVSMAPQQQGGQQ